MSPAEVAIRRIVEQYSRPQPGTGSGLLDAISNLKVDRHDVAGAIHIAEDALDRSSHDEELRPILERLLEFRRGDGRYDAHDMTGILAICNEGLTTLTDAPDSYGPRP
jgi:hypothetical protein